MANHDMKAIAVSGDGDTGSIGFGQFKHVIRRNVPFVYIIENNGVYGLTKGQFSATAEEGLELKYYGKNHFPEIDLAMEAIISGATFVARSFSVDKNQVQALLEAAVHHKGIAVLDIISPCVTFNNEEDSRHSFPYGVKNEIPLHEIQVVNPSGRVTCTAGGYGALDGLEAPAFAAARQRFLTNPGHESLRLTGTKHPDSATYRAAQVERALEAAAAGAADRARLALNHLEWNPLMDARLEFEESSAALLGPCSEVLVDLEGRQISPDWLDVPEKIVLALLRHGVVPGEDRQLLVRVPNPFLEPDEEKISKILASVARTNGGPGDRLRGVSRCHSALAGRLRRSGGGARHRNHERACEHAAEDD